MRALLILTLLGLAVGRLRAAEPLRLSGADCGLEADGATVMLTDAARQPLLRLDGLTLAWSPPHTSGGRAGQTAPDTVRVDYDMADDPTGQVRAFALFRLTGRLLRAEYHLTAPPDANVGGTMILRRVAGSAMGALFKSGLWTRHAHGGVPFEANDGVFRPFAGPRATAWEVIGGNPNWANDNAQHVHLTKLPNAGDWTAVEEFLVTPAATSPAAAAAWYHGRPLALDIDTAQPFNLFEAGAGTPEFTVHLTNAGEQPARRIALSVWARDFDGRRVLDHSESVDLAAGETRSFKLALPDGNRQAMWFVEAGASFGGHECFARTNVAVLEPFAFPHREQSIVGLSAWFPVPSEAAVMDLCRRIGVRWFRSGDSRVVGPKVGAVANWHSAYEPDAWKGKPAASKEQFLQTTLADCDARGNPYWELGNEWDLSKDPALARTYVDDWLKPIARLRAADKSRVEMLTMGFANGFHGVETLRALHAAGGWPYVRGVAYHLGRGNVTPDALGSGWFFLGSLRQAEAVIAELGPKPVYLTEVYACTKPNSWWHDSQRRAAENTVLTFALGLAEGVKEVCFYQLQDSVWYDVGGVNPDDAEYHFGLLDRRGTIKPSLLAYATIVRALDGATTPHYLTFPDQALRGIGCDTPDGPMAILWDRTEGFVQSTQSADYAATEPWVDPWKSHKTVSFATAQAEVTVVDGIGRRTTIAAHDGKVELTLSGAPLIVYGLRL
jgi:hypothetical protein